MQLASARACPGGATTEKLDASPFSSTASPHRGEGKRRACHAASPGAKVGQPFQADGESGLESLTYLFALEARLSLFSKNYSSPALNSLRAMRKIFRVTGIKPIHSRRAR